MSLENIFTNEAHELYLKYVDELKSEFKNTNLSTEDITQNIDDITQQILDLSQFNGHDIVSTDTLKHVLNKLGSPREIISTLTGEQNFVDNMSNTATRNDSKRSTHLIFTAAAIVDKLSTLTKFMYIFAIASIAFLVLALGSGGWDDLSIPYIFLITVYMIIFGIYFGVIYRLDETDRLIKNSYLFHNIKPNSRILYGSVIVMLGHIILIFMSYSEIIWILIIQISAWIFLMIKYVEIFYNNRVHYLE
ncbi:MAG: hypothetical protein GPJ54_09460 [Candidatus Heimdallarchaeota archaeon]|nr:hypothetical protein [Candidatus Heimdallarchaeota archaeon]